MPLTSVVVDGVPAAQYPETLAFAIAVPTAAVPENEVRGTDAADLEPPPPPHPLSAEQTKTAPHKEIELILKQFFKTLLTDKNRLFTTGTLVIENLINK